MSRRWVSIRKRENCHSKKIKEIDMNAQLLDFVVHGDHSGKLVALEEHEDIPFDVRRVYYIWGNSPDVHRGKHAHDKLEQIIICVSGSCDFILDDGNERKTIHLDNPSQGLYIKHDIWREFTNFSKDCVLVVLASEHYKESDYTRNYHDFLRKCTNEK